MRTRKERNRSDGKYLADLRVVVVSCSIIDRYKKLKTVPFFVGSEMLFGTNCKSLNLI